MRLSHRDGDRMLKLLPQLYAHAPPTRFFENSLCLLQDLVGCDHCAWYVYSFADGGSLAVALSRDYDLAPHVLALMEEALPSHPYIAYYQTHAMAAVRLSDLPRRDFLAHYDRYQDVYRRADIHHEMTLPVMQSVGATVGVSFRRNLHDFTERDRTIVDMLQPHLQRAYANSQLIGPQQEGATVTAAWSTAVDLTVRENQVAFWMSEGKTNREIGLILGIGARTVEKHLEHVLYKLRVENRTTAAMRLRHIRQRRSLDSAE